MGNLATSESKYTHLNVGCGPASMHLWMTSWKDNPNGNHDAGTDREIENEISMHLTLPEVEKLISDLKKKLAYCYELRIKYL